MNNEIRYYLSLETAGPRGCPQLPAFPLMNSAGVWAYCRHCRVRHSHGYGTGHREAKCREHRGNVYSTSSPYDDTGYILVPREVLELRKARAHGKRLGAYVPYGWALDGLLVVRNLLEAKAIEVMMKLRIRGQSTASIAESLLEQGLLPRDGGRWRHNEIEAILRREGLAGTCVKAPSHSAHDLSDPHTGPYRRTGPVGLPATSSTV